MFRIGRKINRLPVTLFMNMVDVADDALDGEPKLKAFIKWQMLPDLPETVGTCPGHAIHEKES